MVYRLSELFWSLLGQLAVSVVVGGAAMIWGIFEGVLLWYATIGGVLTATAIFLIISNTGWWKPPLKILIHQWLNNYGFSIRDVPDPDCNFMFYATDSQHRIISVHQPKDRENFIFFLMGYNVSREIDALNGKAQKILGITLRNKLAQKGLHYRNVVPPFDKFSVEYMVPVANLEEREFLDALHRVFQGSIICKEEVLLTKETHEA